MKRKLVLKTILMTERHLTIELDNGDLKAFQTFYSDYYVPLCVYAHRFTKDKEIAEEAVQEVFLKLWEQQGQLKITESLKAYLFTAVRNQCLNHLKHLQVVNKFQHHYSQQLKEAEEYYVISQEIGDSIMIANELQNTITEAVDTLPAQCRKIFIMSRFEGLKHQDIADNLGITLHTVHRQISIGLEKLRRSLKVYLSIFLLLIKLLAF